MQKRHADCGTEGGRGRRRGVLESEDQRPYEDRRWQEKTKKKKIIIARQHLVCDHAWVVLWAEYKQCPPPSHGAAKHARERDEGVVVVVVVGNAAF